MPGLARRRSDRSEEIHFDGIVHAPENEQGVVFLFAKVHRRLGFPSIDIIRTGFPDCWASVRRGSGSRRTWIEFEYRSATFKTHLHDLRRLKPRKGHVVCWEHDWPGCEKHAEVISLACQLGVGRRVWLQSTRPEFQASLDDVPTTAKARDDWTVAPRAKPGDLLLMWRAGSRGQAEAYGADPDLLQSIANVFEITSFPWSTKRWRNQAHVRQVARLKNPLRWGAIKADSVLRHAPWVRASMQGRPDVTRYWWRLHRWIVELNPGLTRDPRFRRIDPARY